MSTFTFPFSMITWGPLAAPKRAMLLHSSMGAGPVWFKVAADLVKAGYRVDCPELLGHGWTSRSSSYSFQTLLSHLEQHLKNEKYDVLAACSFGGLLALCISPLLTHTPSRVVLIDPVIDWSQVYEPELVRKLAEGPKNPPSEEELLRNPGWNRFDAIIKRQAVMAFDSAAIYEMFKEGENHTYSHSLIPPASSTEVIILAADPAVKSVYDAEKHAPMLAEKYPHIKLVRQLGASHDMHKDRPDVVAAVIMGGITAVPDLVVFRS